jgi:hypothetical protein
MGEMRRAEAADRLLPHPESTPAAAATERGRDQPQPGRDLVPVDSGQRTEVAIVRSRPSATFLAQLIAVALRMPQMRRRRRAAPDRARALYADSNTRGAQIGRVVSRSM